MDMIQFIKTHKVIVIARNVSSEKIIDAAQAMLNGGIRLLEVTFDQRNPNVIPDTAHKIQILSRHFAGKLHIGAGTVLTPDQVKAAVDAGAEYIISPNFNPAVVEETIKAGVVSIPGAFTPSEIMAAHDFGAHFIKLFPATALGMGYIKSILSPLSHVSLIATGGVSDANMMQFLSMGFVGVGVGSNIMNNKLIDAGNFDELTRLAIRYTAQIGDSNIAGIPKGTTNQ